MLGMRKYELVLVLPGRMEKANRDALLKKIRDIVVNHGSTIMGEDVWGEKQLAYAINHETIGFYVIWKLDSDGKSLAEVRRLMNFETTLLRYQLLQVTS